MAEWIIELDFDHVVNDNSDHNYSTRQRGRQKIFLLEG